MKSHQAPQPIFPLFQALHQALIARFLLTRFQIKKKIRKQKESQSLSSRHQAQSQQTGYQPPILKYVYPLLEGDLVINSNHNYQITSVYFDK